MQIPVYDEHNNIVSVETFHANLNIRNAPAYLNENCNMGLVRISTGKYKGYLAVLYQDNWHPSCNHGTIISDNEGFELCQNRGKVHLIDKLNIEYNVGIVEVDDD